MFGYSGKILHIDLASQKHWIEENPKIGTRCGSGGLQWLLVSVGKISLPNVTPCRLKIQICVANGIFAGTPVPVGGKFGLASKSPLTGWIGDSLSGSWFSIALKRAGWDGVVLHNSSDKWINVFIDDDKVEFRPATKYLGLGTFQTEEAIRNDLGDDQVRSMTIGSAGEHLVRFANVTNDGRQAGRTGHGMVWGSKKLKALSVRGTKGIKVADPATLMKMSFDITEQAQGPYTAKYRILGTVQNVLNLNKLGLLPTRNYQEGTFEYADQVSGEYLAEHNKVKTIACAQCPIACEQMSLVKRWSV